VIFLGGSGGAGAAVSRADDLDVPVDFGSAEPVVKEKEAKSDKKKEDPKEEPEGEDIPF